MNIPTGPLHGKADNSVFTLSSRWNRQVCFVGNAGSRTPLPASSSESKWGQDTVQPTNLHEDSDVGGPGRH